MEESSVFESSNLRDGRSRNARIRNYRFKCPVLGRQNYGKMRASNVLLLYVLLIAPISIALFLYGFFPIIYHGDAIATQEDIPRHVGNVR